MLAEGSMGCAGSIGGPTLAWHLGTGQAYGKDHGDMVCLRVNPLRPLHDLPRDSQVILARLGQIDFPSGLRYAAEYELAVAAALAVVADPAVAAALAVAADPAVAAALVAAAALVVAAESVVADPAVAEPVAGVVESMRGQAERIGLSPLQRLLYWQRPVLRSPLP